MKCRLLFSGYPACYHVTKIISLSFNANCSSFSLAESPPCDVQITAYKIIMVCSCAMSSNHVWLAANNVPLTHKWNHTFLLLTITLAWKMADCFTSRRYSLKNKLDDWMTKQLLNSVIAKYRDLSVSRRMIILFAEAKRFAYHWKIMIFC